MTWRVAEWQELGRRQVEPLENRCGGDRASELISKRRSRPSNYRVTEDPRTPYDRR